MERAEATTVPLENQLIGREVVDMDGSSVGEIEQVFSNGNNRNGGWAAVVSGLVDKKRLAVPLVDATFEEKIIVPYPKELIAQAPELSGDTLLEAEEISAYRHYNLRRELRDDFQEHADLSDPPAQANAEHESIAKRAYEIYEHRGSEHGRDQEDWLAAERELADRMQSDGTVETLTPDSGIE